jgi:hypothetical protein
MNATYSWPFFALIIYKNLLVLDLKSNAPNNYFECLSWIHPFSKGEYVKYIFLLFFKPLCFIATAKRHNYIYISIMVYFHFSWRNNRKNVRLIGISKCNHVGVEIVVRKCILHKKWHHIWRLLTYSNSKWASCA